MPQNLETQIKEIVQKIIGLTKQFKQNPISFYGEAGKEYLLLAKELHLLGSGLSRHASSKKLIPFDS